MPAPTFLPNAGVLQVLGLNNNESSEAVSGLLGQETVVFNTAARALYSEKSGPCRTACGAPSLQVELAACP